MSTKDYMFELLVPLRLEHYVDIRNLKKNLELISFQIDLKNNYCRIFARTEDDKILIETVEDFFINRYADENFDCYYERILEVFKEKQKYGLQKKNEKKLEPEELSARSRSKKNKLG